MDYYCWLQYYDGQTFKQTNSTEIRYYQGHKHGVKPNAGDWQACLVDLTLKVNQIRLNQAPPLAVLGDNVIDAGAEQKTRSAH